MAELNPPLGTTTPEIFLDNVKRADELVNGPAGTVNDRGGEPLDTWRQMMAKNDEVRQNLIPLSKQYATLAAAQADIANIPAGSTTYVRSQDGSALADEYMNVSGMLTATGRKMPSQAYVEGMQGDIDSLNQMRITLSDSLSDTWRDDRDDKTEVVLVADNALRKLIKLNTDKQKLVVFGNEVPRQGEVDEAREAGSETWSYNGSDADRIILLADSAGRVVRELRLSEQAEYLFGKKVGTGGDASYTPPQYWPEFVDCRAYGQSLSISLNAGAGILTPVTNAFMFDAGIVTYNKTLTSLATVPDTTTQQYHDTSLIHQLEYDSPAPDRKYMAAASGVSGYSMAQLEPGTEPYTQLMSSIDKAAQLAASAGYQYGLPVLTFFQGEADAYLGSSYEYYRSKIVLMQSSINDKAKSVSRVSSDMPMIIYQMASQGRYQGLVNPSSDIPRAQLDEAISNPLIQLCTPMYIFPYTDGVHLTNHGYRWLGLFRAKATRYWMENGKPWKPLYPIDIYKVGSNTVVAAFHVPVGNLQFRTDIVPEHPSGAKGFELWQEMSDTNVWERLDITSVQIIGPDKVKVTSSSAFTGTVYLAYGWTPLNRGASDGDGRYPSWNAGVNSGICGNLCDSDNSTTDLHDAAGNAYQLKNYCCCFCKEAI
ncbi:sialate O-acetylesterase [Klebsiella michiganensis]|uniref:Flagellar biosynthesis, cell-distal portion of basal-body rod n=1 Tax=Klebsiella michiganensis TaxID=1134687 RepID=A0ABR5G636_9ENTR|nr:sialate O-acetylesterase [Klebsiella michiganensis]EWF64881.1 hypothetical protein L387_03753 [Klebsiella michiganensis]KLY25555.1 hypothetical protein SK91_05461 [Klebsiella michiganensis]OUG36571.1 hypothetical protein AZ036_003816 [Klebsiella michiganensis]